MGIKITLEQAIYQGDRIVTFYCENAAGPCSNSGETRLIEMIDSYGPLTRLDELPARCTRCGRREKVDVRARQFRRAGGSHIGPFVEGDGLPYGKEHMTWMG